MFLVGNVSGTFPPSALYGYSIKVELSDKTNFKFDSTGQKLILTDAGKALKGLVKDLVVTVTITPSMPA